MNDNTNVYLRKYLKYKIKYIKLKELTGEPFNIYKVLKSTALRTKNMIIQITLIAILFCIMHNQTRFDFTNTNYIDDLLDKDFLNLVKLIIKYVRCTTHYSNTDEMFIIGITKNINSDIYPNFNKSMIKNKKDYSYNHSPLKYFNKIFDIMNDIKQKTVPQQVLLNLIAIFISKITTYDDNLKIMSLGWIYWIYSRSYKLQKIFNKYFFNNTHKNIWIIPKSINMKYLTEEIIKTKLKNSIVYNKSIASVFWTPKDLNDKLVNFDLFFNIDFSNVYDINSSYFTSLNQLLINGIFYDKIIKKVIKEDSKVIKEDSKVIKEDSKDTTSEYKKENELVNDVHNSIGIQYYKGSNYERFINDINLNFSTVYDTNSNYFNGSKGHLYFKCEEVKKESTNKLYNNSNWINDVGNGIGINYYENTKFINDFNFNLFY